MLALFLAFALNAHADTGASHAITLHAVPGINLSVQMGDGFLPAKQLAANDPYRKFFSLSPSSDQQIYHGRAAYDLPFAPAKLSAAFFQNIDEVQKLLGSGTKLSLVSQTPFVFKSSISEALGLIRIESQTQMAVREISQVPAGLIDGLLRGETKPVRVVIQRTSDFNLFFDRAFMVTLIYPNARGGSHIEVISAVVINEMPPFAGQAGVSKTSRKDLIGYATRLSQEQL